MKKAQLIKHIVASLGECLGDLEKTESPALEAIVARTD